MNKAFDTVNATSQKILNTVDSIVSPVLDHKIVALLLSWVILLNILHSLDNLPNQVKFVILSPYSKIVSLFLGIYYTTRDFKATVFWTIVAVVVYKLFFFVRDGFEVITNTPAVYPGCMNTTVSDLVALFDGDVGQLQKSMYHIGVPVNIKLTDTNAPLISTYFINHGKQVTNDCRGPN